MSSRPPGVVLWDADGVLQSAAPGWRDRLIQIGGEGFPEEVFAAEIPCLTGKVSFVDAVQSVLDRRGLDVPVAEVTGQWARIQVDDRALAVVDEVRARGVRCFLATNQHDLRRDVMRSECLYDGRLDGAFYSCELAVAKPSGAYFDAVLAHLRMSASEVLFLDDSARNVEAARQVGLRAELHDPALGANGLRRILARHGLP